MHVSMVHVSMILDTWSCMYDACIYDTYKCDPQSLTLIHVCMMPISMMRLKFCLGRTNKAILGVGLIFSQQRKLFVFSVTEHIKIPRGPFNGGSAHWKLYQSIGQFKGFGFPQPIDDGSPMKTLFFNWSLGDCLVRFSDWLETQIGLGNLTRWCLAVTVILGGKTLPDLRWGIQGRKLRWIKYNFNNWKMIMRIQMST